MSGKRQKKNRQLSLGFEGVPRQPQPVSDCLEPTDFNANIVSFPAVQDNGANFRKRIRDDLIRNRVIID